MHSRPLRTALFTGVLVALPAIAAAQFPPPPPPPGAPPPVQDRWPAPATPPRQAAPPQQQQQQPAAAPSAAQQAAPKPRPAQPANVVACSGVFGRDSAHLKLAMRFDSRNLVFTKIPGPEGSQLDASVLFPNDPKRRLEVMWNNNAGRSETSMIAINGQSQWSGPKGVKLGLTLPALEKINGRPFRVSGIDKEGMASVTDWQGGALSTLPGGCQVGVRLAPDRKSPEAAIAAVTGDHSLMSNDAALRAVKPTAGEIILGY